MKRPDISPPPNPKTPLGALHALAANLILKPCDMIVHENGKSAEIIAAHADCQRRLVGRKGQNINALKEIAAWLGFKDLILAEPDPRTVGLGAPCEYPRQGANLRESMEVRAFFRQITAALFEAAGCNVGVDVGTDETAGEIFIACTLANNARPAGNIPNPETAAAIAKILRGLAVRHHWQDIQFSCE